MSEKECYTNRHIRTSHDIRVFSSKLFVPRLRIWCYINKNFELEDIFNVKE